MSVVNQAALDLIKNFEGLFKTAYRCPAGVLTIGYGHTGPDVKEGMYISEAQADDLLEKDIAKSATGVKGFVRVPLNENQFGALCSFVFNLGIGNFSGSTLLKELNKEDYSCAADEFLKWDHCNGQVLSGLTRRRKAERDLFLRVPNET